MADADLSRLVGIWPSLSDNVKAEILSLAGLSGVRTEVTETEEGFTFKTVVD